MLQASQNARLYKVGGKLLCEEQQLLSVPLYSWCRNHSSLVDLDE